jgi:hypothetical protein
VLDSVAAQEGLSVGRDFFSAVWPKLVLTFGGVELDVIGAGNLTAIRPAAEFCPTTLRCPLSVHGGRESEDHGAGNAVLSR